MTRSQVIQLVKADTAHKMDNIQGFDFQAKLSQVAQEFCAEYRYWWRKKRLAFSTTAGTASYDFSGGTSSVTTVPAGAGAYIEEITQIILIDSTGATVQINPVTDDTSIAQYEADTTQAQPSVWMPDESSLSNVQAIRLGKIPNGTYSMKMFFWAMPNQAVDTSDDVIYIIPPFLHHVLQTGLEREVWRLAYGEQDARFVSAAQLYKKKVDAAKVKRSIDGSKVQRFINQDSEAIRSTGSWPTSSDLT